MLKNSLNSSLQQIRRCLHSSMGCMQADSTGLSGSLFSWPLSVDGFKGLVVPEKCFKPEKMLITPFCDPGELEGSLLGLLLAEPDFGYTLFCTCPHEIYWFHILLPGVYQSHKFQITLHGVISSRRCTRLLGDYLLHNFSHIPVVRCVNGMPWSSDPSPLGEEKTRKLHYQLTSQELLFKYFIFSY